MKPTKEGAGVGLEQGRRDRGFSHESGRFTIDSHQVGSMIGGSVVIHVWDKGVMRSWGWGE